MVRPLQKNAKQIWRIGLQAISDLTLPAHLSSRCSGFTLSQKIVRKMCEDPIYIVYPLIESVWPHRTPEYANLSSS